MTFMLDGRRVDVTHLSGAARQEMETEVFHRLCRRVSERRWRKAAGNIWRLLCLWSA